MKFFKTKKEWYESKGVSDKKRGLHRTKKAQESGQLIAIPKGAKYIEIKN